LRTLIAKPLFSQTKKEGDGPGVHLVLRHGVGPNRRFFDDRHAVFVVAHRHAGNLVGAAAQALVRVVDQLRGHVLELQRGDGAAELLAELLDAGVIGMVCARVGRRSVHQRLHLLISTVKALQQGVA